MYEAAEGTIKGLIRIPFAEFFLICLPTGRLWEMPPFIYIPGKGISFIGLMYLFIPGFGGSGFAVTNPIH